MLSWARMSGVYLRVYNLLPEALKKRINPLDYAIDDFAREAAAREPGGLVLDAGAGESRFGRVTSEATNTSRSIPAWATPPWDYSKVSLLAEPQPRSRLRMASSTRFSTSRCSSTSPTRRLSVCEFVPGLETGEAGCTLQRRRVGTNTSRLRLLSGSRSTPSSGLSRRPASPRRRSSPLGGYFHYLGHRLTYVPKSLFPAFPGRRESCSRLLKS